jgi:uncharacterized protein (TIGR00730 family)
MMIKKICVNCGSNYGSKDIYKNEAIKLGKFFAKNKIDIIYGGAEVGLMGEIANAALSENGNVIGIIPKAIEEKVGHKNLTKLYVVETMHERKKMMFELSDGFIAFPGGLGTLEEILELLTWSQLGFHHKPCGFLNIANYYDKFIDFLDYSEKEKFIKKEHKEMIIVENNIENMIKKFNNYKSVKVEKWIK